MREVQGSAVTGNQCGQKARLPRPQPPQRRAWDATFNPTYACVAIADTARFSHFPPIKSGNSTGALPRATDV